MTTSKALLKSPAPAGDIHHQASCEKPRPFQQHLPVTQPQRLTETQLAALPGSPDPPYPRLALTQQSAHEDDDLRGGGEVPVAPLLAAPAAARRAAVAAPRHAARRPPALALPLSEPAGRSGEAARRRREPRLVRSPRCCVPGSEFGSSCRRERRGGDTAGCPLPPAVPCFSLPQRLSGEPAERPPRCPSAPPVAPRRARQSARPPAGSPLALPPLMLPALPTAGSRRTPAAPQRKQLVGESREADGPPTSLRESPAQPGRRAEPHSPAASHRAHRGAELPPPPSRGQRGSEGRHFVGVCRGRDALLPAPPRDGSPLWAPRLPRRVFQSRSRNLNFHVCYPLKSCELVEICIILNLYSVQIYI